MVPMLRRPAPAERENAVSDALAGVADADPPDEVDDAEGAGDGDVVPPHADAARDGDDDAGEEQAGAGQPDEEEREPAGPRVLPDVVEQRFVERAVVQPSLEEGRRGELAARLEGDALSHGPPAPGGG